MLGINFKRNVQTVTVVEFERNECVWVWRNGDWQPGIVLSSLHTIADVMQRQYEVVTVRTQTDTRWSDVGGTFVPFFSNVQIDPSLVQKAVIAAV
jgi:hypothetical protein